jgi:hypothetical protein
MSFPRHFRSTAKEKRDEKKATRSDSHESILGGALGPPKDPP